MFLGLVLYAYVFNFITVTAILLNSNNVTRKTHIRGLLSKYNWILETSIGLGGKYMVSDRHYILLSFYFLQECE